MQDLLVIRRYAKSLFNEAQAKNELRACQQGLDEFVRVAKLKKSLSEILSHPFIVADEKKKMIHSALGEYATPLLERFFGLLVRKRRLNMLFEIAREFQELVDRFQNMQSLRVRSAFPLSEAQKKQLQQALEKWLNSKVRMDVQVDAQLIGGLVIQTRDHILDQSLKGQLAKLKAQLAA